MQVSVFGISKLQGLECHEAEYLPIMDMGLGQAPQRPHEEETSIPVTTKWATAKRHSC